MRIKITILVLFSCITFVNGQELNKNARYIKDKYPAEYENILKRNALKEWKDDYSMVIYEINKQADSIFDVVSSFERENTSIMFKAIQEWSIDGYSNYNMNILKEMKIFELTSLLKMYCDWSMVKFEYNKQLKAKKSL